MLDKDRVIAGKYRLKRVIGEGGIGAVWEATHLTLDSPVAIKFIDAVVQKRVIQGMSLNI